jgi:hypothetical protein
MKLRNLSIGLLVAMTMLLPAWLAPGAAPEGALPGAVTAPGGIDQGHTFSQELWISSPPVPAEADRYQIDVAYNYPHDEYLVVWQNNRPGSKDIYARRVAGNRQIRSWFAVIAQPPSNYIQPAVAYNASDAEYLVVWLKDADGDGYGEEIWGRRIAWDGGYILPEFPIFSWANRVFLKPRVIWNHNRNQYLVVWNAFDATTMQPNDVAGRRIGPDGTILDASPKIFTSGTFPHQADVAYNWSTDEYMVVFVRVYSAATTGNDVYAVIANWEGNVRMDIGALAIANTDRHENAPAVVGSAEGNYLVAWEREYNAADHDIYGSRLQADGTLVESYSAATSAADDRRPRVAFDFDRERFLFVWERVQPAPGAVLAWYIGAGVYSGWITVASYELWSHGSPDVAGGSFFLVAYEGESSNPLDERHVYGKVFAPYTLSLPLVRRNH